MQDVHHVAIVIGGGVDGLVVSAAAIFEWT
jgi:hypothetical protein